MTLPERLRAVLHLDDPPRRIALALAVGVFISCTPFWGLQTLLSVVVAMAFGLNRAATVAGTWLNLPWFAPFVYGAALKVGGLVMPGRIRGRPSLEELLASHGEDLWERAVTWIHASTLPLLVGTTIVGAVAGAATYVVALGLVSRRRGRRRPGADAGV